MYEVEVEKLLMMRGMKSSCSEKSSYCFWTTLWVFTGAHGPEAVEVEAFGGAGEMREEAA